MNWPQITVIVLAALNLLFTARVHGIPRGGEHNFWIIAVSTAIFIFVLFAGGFWETSS